MKALALFFCLAGCGEARVVRPEVVQPTAPAMVRWIQTCVVEDASAPVPAGLMHDVFETVRREYREQVGVDFVPVAWVRAPFKPSGWPMDIAFALRAACPKEAEIRLVLSNRFVAPKDASMTAKGDGGQMAGDSHPFYGFVIAYSVEERWKARDAGGNRAIVSTLLHEFAHLFGVDHVDDKRSFMFPSSNDSEGRWTPDVEASLRAARLKRWWPKA